MSWSPAVVGRACRGPLPGERSRSELLDIQALDRGGDEHDPQGGVLALARDARQRPRYARLRSSLRNSDSALPDRTISPVASTYPRSAIDSAMAAFCSTMRIATPASWTSLMIVKFC